MHYNDIDQCFAGQEFQDCDAIISHRGCRTRTSMKNWPPVRMDTCYNIIKFSCLKNLSWNMHASSCLHFLNTPSSTNNHHYSPLVSSAYYRSQIHSKRSCVEMQLDAWYATKKRIMEAVVIQLTADKWTYDWRDEWRQVKLPHGTYRTKCQLWVQQPPAKVIAECAGPSVLIAKFAFGSLDVDQMTDEKKNVSWSNFLSRELN